jgi:hypothetical protein
MYALLNWGKRKLSRDEDVSAYKTSSHLRFEDDDDDNMDAGDEGDEEEEEHHADDVRRRKSLKHKVT